MAAIPIWNTSPSVNTSRYRRRKLPRTQYDHTMGAGAGTAKPTSMFKNPLGKMSPEELKDFQEVLKEMNFNMKPEFVSPGRTNQPQMGSFKHQPFLFDEATAAEYQRRRKLNPYV